MLRVAKLNIHKHDKNPSFDSTINPTLQTISTNNKIPDHPAYANCVPSWSIDLDEIAFEELDTPEPCSYTEPLLLLNNSRETVLSTYHDLLITNINPDFVLACPLIIDFFKSDVALSVLCPIG